MNEFWEEQMKHEQTRLYYEKLKKLIKNYINKTYISFIDGIEVLEIGLDVGISARCFIEFPNIKLTSVDCGDVEIGIREIEALGIKDRWTFHHMTSDKFFEKNNNACDGLEVWKSFDIIYIDGDHSYEQVKKDINNAWDCLNKNGILIGHDIIHKNNFTNDSDCGVTQAFAEFIREQNVEAHIYPPHPGLIVIKKI